MADLSKHLPYRRMAFSKHLRLALLPPDPTDLDLVANDYYRGFPCPLDHTIRNNDKHWCYECVKKIQSNICCFDINYTNTIYQNKALELLKPLLDKDPKECWPYQGERDSRGYPSRLYFPSYRSAFTGRTMERLTVHKALYTLCWGDVGGMTVTRTCGDPLCVNPLHMTTSWHMTGMAPRKMQFLITEHDHTKLLNAAKALRKGRTLSSLAKNQYRQTIRDPHLDKESLFT